MDCSGDQHLAASRSFAPAWWTQERKEPSAHGPADLIYALAMEVVSAWQQLPDEVAILVVAQADAAELLVLTAVHQDMLTFQVVQVSAYPTTSCSRWPQLDEKAADSPDWREQAFSMGGEHGTKVGAMAGGSTWGRLSWASGFLHGPACWRRACTGGSRAPGLGPGLASSLCAAASQAAV